MDVRRRHFLEKELNEENAALYPRCRNEVRKAGVEASEGRAVQGVAEGRGQEYHIKRRWQRAGFHGMDEGASG
jgi:hypothetical protein